MDFSSSTGKPQQFTHGQAPDPKGYGHTDADTSASVNSKPQPSRTFIDEVEAIELGEGERGILELIDSLREAGVDKYVDLPIVLSAGDQSAGKSSILEALTGLDFPRADGKCTRFATEIAIKHGKTREMHAQIIPPADATDAERKRYAELPNKIPRGASFKDIMSIATDLICPPERTIFWSKATLSVEAISPGSNHFTVVDLPGLIQSTGRQGASAELEAEYVEAILQIACHYMKAKRAIILVVVRADIDPQNQRVLSPRIRDIDPLGEKSFGIITMPDRIQSSERGEYFLSLARNQREYKFNLGWHVVRNRTPDENSKRRSLEARNQVEMDFFNTDPIWKELNKDQVGIAALKKRISGQVVQHVVLEMPNVQREVKAKLEECTKELEKIGTNRATPEGMRQELEKRFDRSYSIARDAQIGYYYDYADKAFFCEDSRFLVARVVSANTVFSREMLNNGCLYDLIDDDREEQDAPPVLKSGISVKKKSDYIRERVQPLLQTRNGRQFPGNADQYLAYDLFQELSQKWGGIAQEHIKTVLALCNNFWWAILIEEWPEDMRSRVLERFVRPEMDRRHKAAVDEAKKLLDDRTRMVPPYDPVFNDTMSLWRNKQQLRLDSEGNVIEVAQMKPKFEAAKVLEETLAFYNLNLRTFISNVVTQVIERHLLDKFEDIFKPRQLYAMTTQEMVKLAHEREDVRRNRAELSERKSILEKGDARCTEYMLHHGVEFEDLLHSYAPERKATIKKSASEVHLVPQREAYRPSTPQPQRVQHGSAEPTSNFLRLPTEQHSQRVPVPPQSGYAQKQQQPQQTQYVNQQAQQQAQLPLPQRQPPLQQHQPPAVPSRPSAGYAQQQQFADHDNPFPTQNSGPYHAVPQAQHSPNLNPYPSAPGPQQGYSATPTTPQVPIASGYYQGQPTGTPENRARGFSQASVESDAQSIDSEFPGRKKKNWPKILKREG